MFNSYGQTKAGATDVPLGIFGGVAPEMSNTDLPEGASAGNQDVDFSLGKVFTRPGVENVFSFGSGNFIELNAGAGASIEGSLPNETPWINPNDITLDSPPAYASVTLNVPNSAPGPGSSLFDKGASATGFGQVMTVPAQTPTNPYEIAITAVAWGAPGLGNISSPFGTTPYALTSASNAVGGNTTYVGVFSPPLAVGTSVAVFGFSNSGNNSGNFSYPACFPVVSCTGTQLVLANPGGVAETHAGQAYLQWATVNFSSGEDLGGVPLVYTLGLQPSVVGMAALNHPQNWQAWTGFLTNGNRPTITSMGLESFTTPVPSHTAISYPSPVAGATILVVFASSQSSSSGANTSVPTIADNFGNTYVNEYWYSGGSSGALGIWVATGITAGGALTATITSGDANDIASEGVTGYQIQGQTGPGGGTSDVSQILQANAYPFTIPSATVPVGFQVEVFGHQTSGSSDATLTLSLINPQPLSPTYTFQLPGSDGEIVLGTPTSKWGYNVLSAALFDNPAFGVNITAQAPGGEEVTFDIYAVKIKVWLTTGADFFLYIKTFTQQNEMLEGFGEGGVLTLALDTDGVFWQEDVVNDPDVLVPFYTAIEPGTYAKSVTFESHEYIALSNLLNGTDMPRQYDGVNVDRISQVGPGAPPSIAFTTTTYPIISITQPAAVISQVGGPGISALLWSVGPGNNTQAGNVITIYYGTPGTGNPVTPADPNILVGGVVYLNGFANLKSGANPNATYVITSVSGTSGFKGNIYNSFTVAAASSQLEDDDGIDNPAPTGTYNATLATLKTSVPVPNLQVGSQFTVTGNSVPAWNETWTVTATPNAAVLQITQTSLTGDVATYDYVLVSGTAPIVGSQVTITGSTNGPTLPNGLTIFDVANATVATATPSQFTINLVGANVPPAPETECQAQINGTIFQFEPGLSFVGDTPTVPPPGPNDPIFGNGTGGFLTEAGQLGAGLRTCVLLFQTRNGYITGPSPYIQFNLSEGAATIVATNIAIGPPETIARILCFTGANGSQYYYIPKPVTVISNSQAVTYTATVINDNITTQASFQFTDALLLSSTEIDVPGGNLFNLVELGSCIGVIDFSDRLFFWGEQNKVQNLINMTFDGGFLPNPGSPILPLGWTVDLTNGAGGSLVTSPLYGNAYYIKNSTGSTQALYGMLEQSAYQDQYLVGIVIPNFTYGARVTASCPSQIGAGSFNADIYSPSFGLIYGKFSIPLASMGTTMEIFTGNVMTTAFVTTVPPDLQVRIYAAAIPNGGDVMVDRIELFPLQQPVLQNQFRASYGADENGDPDPESFDGITGNCGPSQDNKPIRGAVVLFDSLYCLKSESGGTYVTTDNGITEPNQWTWKTVSKRIGTMGIHAYDYGENWFITADRQGLYGYGGGPMNKMSQEIQPVWDMITNRQATIVRNDIYNRRVTIFCCIPTPNQYMPELPVNANPTEPNVCIAMNYRELDSVEALVNGKPIHQTFMGTIKAFDFVRKWSYWNIQAPYADFCQRNDGSEQLLICSGTQPKIYQLDPDMLSDDGLPINSWYMTYGFVRPDTQQAVGLGLGEMLLGYLKMTIIGNGGLTLADFPNDPSTATPNFMQPVTITDPANGDVECPLNDVGYRFFMKVGTNAVGDWFELSKMVVTMSVNPWAPVSGVGF